MLCESESLGRCELRLTYLHPDTDEQMTFNDVATSQQLRRYFVETCGTYADWLSLIKRLHTGGPIFYVAWISLMRIFVTIRETSHVLVTRF
ncbi:MAG: hypothetical protein Ct9H300mP8_09740 [Gammaproteobacteria bacterium]|nr:MAG: hypothetical protein Ct9H300mP8_09740 [Gammaproteobacteria bacterium]